ncbi:MAG: DUF4270 domain-containing protein [Flavobacterium sp.]|nr:DUF4270 domain-containing protein [Flavobacterium sp.]
MYKNSFFSQVLLGLTAMLIISCDKDFNEIGADIIGDDHYNFELKSYDIAANTVGTGPVQSNNLPINPLGIYNNPVFGKTKAHFVTQLELKTPNPTIGTNIQMTSVTLSVPLFSHVVSNNSDGSKTYAIDSLLGSSNQIFDLKVYRSGYFLGDVGYEGPTQITQKYYSNQTPDIDGLKHPTVLNNGPGSENENFFFNPAEREDTVVNSEGESSVVKSVPALRLELDKDYFKTHVLEAGATNLQSNNAFKNHFRGLYFKVAEAGTSAGALAMLDFTKGIVTIKYKADITTTTSTGTTTTNMDLSLILNMTGNTVSLLENEPSAEYQSALNADFDEEQGQSRLFLKGGEGSVATIDIFGNTDANSNGDPDAPDGIPNGIPDALDELRTKNWLINEASLTFYVDRDMMGSESSEVPDAPEPERIYLYDIPNKRQILDYAFDNTKGRTTKLDKGIYGGILEKSADDRGIKYKIRVTNYVRSLVGQDSTYVRLGLSVTENINLITMAKVRLENPVTEPLNKFIPTASVVSPVGTVLYGSNIQNSTPNDPDSDYYKRARLEIYYTEPTNNQ